MATDFLAGCIGGCVGVLVGHPFDTVKVRLQTQSASKPIYKGTFHCFADIVKKESLLGLYKGMSSPMAGLALINAIVFGVQGNVQRSLSQPDLLTSHFSAGAVAGVAQCVVCSPMELAKTKMQMQGMGEGRSAMQKHMMYKNPVDCLRQIHRTEGIRGVFRGLTITLVRETPSFGMYFLAYEGICRQLHNDPAEPIGTLKLMLAGGLAGICSWLSTYPADVIKSRYQADGFGTKRKYSTLADCVVKSYHHGGVRIFFTGLNSTLIRAFPVNAATFTTVAWVLRLVRADEDASDDY